ncbi:hypothetical protein, partial [Acidovorax sp. SUPP1855]|uniref:hypothetical protein n=1 Tax=Acidovorax sp. SUPP1855 TaxID=431774 RepID=UPI0024E07483
PGLQGPSCTQAQTAAGPHHAQTAAGAHSFLFGFVKHGVVRGSQIRRSFMDFAFWQSKLAACTPEASAKSESKNPPIRMI